MVKIVSIIMQLMYVVYRPKMYLNIHNYVVWRLKTIAICILKSANPIIATVLYYDTASVFSMKQAML